MENCHMTNAHWVARARSRDHIIRILKQCNIPLTDLEQAASDRDRWSCLMSWWFQSACHFRPSRLLKNSVVVDIVLPTSCQKDPLVHSVVVSAPLSLWTHLGSHQIRPPYPLSNSTTCSSNSTDYCKQATRVIYSRNHIWEGVWIGILKPNLKNVKRGILWNLLHRF